MKPFLLLCVFIFFATVHARVSYNGYKMYEVIPKTPEQLRILQEMSTESRADQVDFWKPPRGINVPVHISVPPNSQVVGIFRLMGMSVKTLMENVQEYINTQNQVDLKFRPQGQATQFDYGQYHNLSAINDWITNITTVYADKTKVIEVGKSFEGRTIRLIQIDTGKVQQKNGFFIEGGIHAREWISPATLIYMTGQMLDLYGKDAKITDIVDSYTWYILPVFNVDGYEYTWTKNRMWRKTRSKHGLCYGVDPNRNWDYKWCESGASKEACSDTYCGPSAFSEVEVKAVSEFIENHKDIKAFIDFHSYSQLWMSPWGWTHDKPVDYDTEDKGSVAAVDALKKVYGTEYQHGNIADVIYIASGSSADWTYGACKIKYSYAVELRDTGKYGFLLPADQIIPSGVETLEAMKSLCSYVFHN